MVTYSGSMKKLNDFCPLTQSTTLAGFDNMLHRASFMKANSIALLPEKAYCVHRRTLFESHESLRFYSIKKPHLKICPAQSHQHGEKTIGKFRVNGFDKAKESVFENQVCYFHEHDKCMPSTAKNAN